MEIEDKELLAEMHARLQGPETPLLERASLMGYSLAVPARAKPARLRSLLKKIEQLAGGLNMEEANIVRLALDQRLAAVGEDPIFGFEA